MNLVAVKDNVRRGPGDSPRCHECPFSKDARPSQPVRGEGPEDPLYILLGEGPGENERQSGRPFVGASGALLNRSLKMIGADRGRAWVTNTLLCTPREASDAQKRQARDCCKPRLEAELAMFPGKPVSALGAIAAQALLGDRQSIKQMAGATYDLPDGRVVVPTIHPAAVLRGAEIGEDQSGVGAHRGDLAFWNLAYDVGKVIRFSEGKLLRVKQDVAVEWKNGERAADLLEEIAKEIITDGLGACDTETDNLRPLLSTMTAIGLATTKRAVAVRWDIIGPRGRAAIQSVFSRPWVRMAFHNVLYDRPVLRKHGFDLACKLEDTLLKHHSAFPGLAHDLQRVFTQFYVAPPWKSEFRQGKKNKELFEDLTQVPGGLPADEEDRRWYALLWYNGCDTLATARLVPPLAECLDKFDAWASYREDMEQVPIAAEMHENGVPLNLERNSEMARFFELRLKKARTVFDEKASDPTIRTRFLDYLAQEQAKVIRKATKAGRAADPPGYMDRWALRLAELKLREDTKKQVTFNINQPMHVVAYLKARGVPMFMETKKGRLSAGEKALRPLRHLPEVRALMAYRENKVELGTFIIGVRKSLYPDGRFHSAISISKITGRWSFQDPQAQNWSKGKVKWVCMHCGRLEKEHKEKTEAGYLCPDVVGQAVWPEGVYPNEWTKPGIPTAFKKEKGTYENWRRKWLRADGSVHEQGLDNAGMPNLRWQVTAPPGFKLVGFDMAQLEARLIALVSGDDWLIRVFAEDRDIHSEFARVVWADFDQQQVDLKKRLRDFIKRTEYGAMYGGTVDTLWQNLLKDDPNVKRQDVAKVVYLIQQTLPGLMAWHQLLLRQVMLPPHEIRSIFGRRFVFPLGTCSPTDVYNSTVQSAGAGVMARGLKKLFACTRTDDRWSRVEPILQIHDACVFVCPEEQAEEFCVLVKASFEQEHTHNGKTVRFPADARVADDWGGL